MVERPFVSFHHRFRAGALTSASPASIVSSMAEGEDGGAED
jgi:hypothetical protein